MHADGNMPLNETVAFTGEAKPPKAPVFETVITSYVKSIKAAIVME
jgi:hypothetical protein